MFECTSRQHTYTKLKITCYKYKNIFIYIYNIFSKITKLKVMKGLIIKYWIFFMGTNQHKFHQDWTRPVASSASKGSHQPVHLRISLAAWWASRCSYVKKWDICGTSMVDCLMSLAVLLVRFRVDVHSRLAIVLPGSQTSVCRPWKKRISDV